jgi:hypothetical protein
MTTNRTPIQRPSQTMITNRALDLYAAMGKLRCTCPPPPPAYWKRKPCPGCERWFDLDATLHTELGLRPWQCPATARQGPRRAGSTYTNEEIAARMKALQQAAARRAATLQGRTPDAEPVTGQDTFT